MRRMRKYLSIFLVFALVISMTSIPAKAIDTTASGSEDVEISDSNDKMYLCETDEYTICIAKCDEYDKKEIALIFKDTPEITYQMFIDHTDKAYNSNWTELKEWAMENIQSARKIYAGESLNTIVYNPDVAEYAAVSSTISNMFTTKLKAIYGTTYTEKTIASKTYSGVACKVTQTLSYHISNASQTTLAEALSVAVTAVNIVTAIASIMSGGITAALLKPLIAEICNVAVSAILPKGTVINSYFCTASFMRISYAGNIMYYNYSDNLTHVGVYSKSGAMETTVHAEVCDSAYNDTSTMMQNAWYQYNRTH